MPLSQSCRRSHSKAVPTPRGPAGVWFLLLTVTVGSRRKVPSVYMHGFPCLPTIQTKNGKENSEIENHSTTKQKSEIPGKQDMVSQPKMGARDSCHL